MNDEERRAAWAALRMIGEAVGELFGPEASMQSEDTIGPEFHDYAEAIIEALQRVAASK
ncbi:hypothetical protein [Mesorhizobium sp. CA4]|uniref:hypothetical protein n=1 Tax=Mesorhizobium sp. CA4 TaxID=588499 RepID=UPI001CD118E4|nr:hypothetical protein [Mesorhizobium sp. CA4]MBZ9821913.1 hypothetical protein [Mesorhizobium sp. CA4]